jgi:hypothetical protein
MNVEPCTNESHRECTNTSCRKRDYESQSESDPQSVSEDAQQDSAHDMDTPEPPGAAAARAQFTSAVQRLDVSTAVDLLHQNFDLIATGTWFWLPKLNLTYEGIVQRLIQLESRSPGMFTAYPDSTDCPSPPRS